MSDWTWYPQYQLYFSPAQSLWAKPNERTGAWEYVSAGETSSAGASGSVGVREGGSNTSNDRGGVTGTREDNDGAKLDQSKRADLEEDETGLKGVTTLEDVGWSFDLPESTSGNSKPTKPDKTKAKATRPQEVAYDPAMELNSQSTIPLRQSAITGADPEAPSSPALLRLVVISTSIPFTTTNASNPPSTSVPGMSSSKSTVGNSKVAIITATPSGVQIGRDKAYRPRIRLKELDVSKVHANVYWSEVEGKEPGWFVVDNGSTHGTFLLQPSQPKRSIPTRLSPPKHSSPPFTLQHLSLLTIGSTTFECHVHKDWPCETCALGENGDSIDTSPDTTGKEEDASAIQKHLSTFSGDSTTVRAQPSPVVLANPNGEWKDTEARRVALTAQAKRDDTTRRSKLAMKNLKASYFGEGGGGGGCGTGKKGGRKRKVDGKVNGDEDGTNMDNVADGQARKRQAQESGGNAEPLGRNRFQTT